MGFEMIRGSKNSWARTRTSERAMPDSEPRITWENSEDALLIQIVRTKSHCGAHIAGKDIPSARRGGKHPGSQIPDLVRTCRYRQALCDPKLSRNTTVIVLRKLGRHFQDADFASAWSAAGRFCGQRERLTADSRRKAGVVQVGSCALQLQRASEPISRAPRPPSMCRTDGSLNRCQSSNASTQQCPPNRAPDEIPPRLSFYAGRPHSIGGAPPLAGRKTVGAPRCGALCILVLRVGAHLAATPVLLSRRIHLNRTEVRRLDAGQIATWQSAQKSMKRFSGAAPVRVDRGSLAA